MEVFIFVETNYLHCWRELKVSIKTKFLVINHIFYLTLRMNESEPDISGRQSPTIPTISASQSTRLMLRMCSLQIHILNESNSHHTKVKKSSVQKSLEGKRIFQNKSRQSKTLHETDTHVCSNCFKLRLRAIRKSCLIEKEESKTRTSRKISEIVNYNGRKTERTGLGNLIPSSASFIWSLLSRWIELEASETIFFKLTRSVLLLFAARKNLNARIIF